MAEDNRCRHCLGSGKATYTRNTYYDYEETCHLCRGTGRKDKIVVDREVLLLLEPLETMAGVFEKADDGSAIATLQMDLLRQFVASIKALSEKLRG